MAWNIVVEHKVFRMKIFFSGFGEIPIYVARSILPMVGFVRSRKESGLLQNYRYNYNNCAMFMPSLVKFRSVVLELEE